jgi:pimeloyl-ACP methyl ester carboxylesterase
MTAKKRSVVLINGLWMTPLIWEDWVKHYSDMGYHVLAPSWPRMDRPIEDIRANPAILNGLGVDEIVEHYEKIIKGLKEPPIIMGHSFGGLFAQILADRALGSAVVAIASAPVKGMLILPFSTAGASFPALGNPFTSNRAAPLTPEQFQYVFGSLLGREESGRAYGRYAVPGPDHALFQAGFANFNPHASTLVDFHNNDRSPLLLIAGGKDHVSPASVIRRNFHLHRESAAVTEFKEYAQHSHFILGEKGWEQVADYALSWAEQALQPERAAIEDDELVVAGR